MLICVWSSEHLQTLLFFTVVSLFAMADLFGADDPRLAVTCGTAAGLYGRCCGIWTMHSPRNLKGGCAAGISMLVEALPQHSCSSMVVDCMEYLLVVGSRYIVQIPRL